MAYTNEALGKALEDLTLAYNNFIEKAKEAAIAAMGDTVIAQIKQDAKDHISAELASQKAALEQAIENAKIAIIVLVYCLEAASVSAWSVMAKR